MKTADVKRIIEAALLCAQQPMPVAELRRLFAEEVEVGADTVRALLDELRGDWHGRGVELVPLASGWRFQTAPDIARFVTRLHPERPPRYSRAVLETLAIIAYRQPVTRGDIEEIRGVAVSAQIVKTLEDRGWIEVIGHKDVIGRPALFATTRQFLDDLGLRTLQELPSLEADGAAAQALEQRLLALPEAGADAPVQDVASTSGVDGAPAGTGGEAIVEAAPGIDPANAIGDVAAVTDGSRIADGAIESDASVSSDAPVPHDAPSTHDVPSTHDDTGGAPDAHAAGTDDDGASPSSGAAPTASADDPALSAERPQGAAPTAGASQTPSAPHRPAFDYQPDP